MTDSIEHILVGKTLVTHVYKLTHEGNHATIWRGLVDNMPVIIKEHPLASNASELIHDWRKYRVQIDNLAKRTGIGALSTIDLEVSNKRIRFVDQMAKEPDVSNLIGQESISTSEKMKLLAKLLCCFCAIPYDAGYHTNYMLDGEFSNFCPNSHGAFDYIDLFPARLRQASNELLKPNEEHIAGKRSLALETFITGDIYGIVGRFWGMLRRDQPLLWEMAPMHPALQQALAIIPLELKRYSEHLFQTDTAFVQNVYRYGMQDTQSMRLHTILDKWISRDRTSPPVPLE